ncbi:MAG: T9SS type A sorting domain-containing protein, partial [Ignavibacteria bacterium]|nr:T9SS type A sorting domain-containing protein [Ignavibacteria bacterium]
FNPSTTIQYDLKNSGMVTLKILNTSGSEVAELINEFQNRGSYSINFDTGKFGLASGVYFYRLTSGVESITKSMLLIK